MIWRNFTLDLVKHYNYINEILKISSERYLKQ